MELLRRYKTQETFTDASGNIGMRRYKRLDKSMASVTIETNRQTTLDLISLQQYGTPLLFWLIADFNDILDPMIDIPKGTNLKIPVID